MKTSGRRLLVGALGLITACSGSGSGGGSPAGSPAAPSSSSEAASPTVSATPSVVDSPAPTSSSGARTCVSASVGPEVECQLEAGTYSTVGMRPDFTYSVPSGGWSSLNREAAPGNFHLFPPGGSMAGFADGTTDDITIVTAVVPPGTCTGEPSEAFARTFDGLVDFLTTNDRIAVTNRADASVGGRAGTVMDIRFVKGDGCPDGDYADLMIGVDPAHGAFGITPGMVGARLFLLHQPAIGEPLAILVDDAANGGSDYGDGAAWSAAAGSVIETLVFAP